MEFIYLPPFQNLRDLKPEKLKLSKKQLIKFEFTVA